MRRSCSLRREGAEFNASLKPLLGFSLVLFTPPISPTEDISVLTLLPSFLSPSLISAIFNHDSMPELCSQAMSRRRVKMSYMSIDASHKRFLRSCSRLEHRLRR